MTISPVTPLGNFPYQMTPLTNVGAFTYRDGRTYLEVLYALRDYINDVLVGETNTNLDKMWTEFQAGIQNMEARIVENEEMHNTLVANTVAFVNQQVDGMHIYVNTSTGEARAYVDGEVLKAKQFVTDSIQVVQNKSGPIDIQRTTLTDNTHLVEILPIWPNNQPVTFSLKQDATGGRTVTMADYIKGSLTLDSSPNGVTDFTLLPNGDGTWNIRQYSGKLVVNVEDYARLAGALGQNWGPAFQAAINAVGSAGGGEVWLRGKSYITTQEITNTYSNVLLVGQGGASEIVQNGAMTNVLSFKGTYPDKASPTAVLTADAGWSNANTAAGATVTLSTVAGIATDDILLVGDDTVIPWTGGLWNTRNNGELQRVKSVAGNVVTFYGRLRGSYTVAANASVHKISAIRNVGIKDLSVRNANPGTTVTALTNFIACRNVMVSGCSFSGGDGPAVQLDYVYQADVRGLLVRDLTDDAANNRYGYGVNIGASESVRVSDSTFLRCRHGVTTNGHDGHRGYAQDFRVSDCIVTESTGAGFDTHPGSTGTFTNCKAWGMGDSGFSIRSQVNLVDCEAAHCNIGVYIQGAASHDVKIQGMMIHHTQGAGISTWGSAEAGYPTRLQIIDAAISDTQSMGISLSGALNNVQVIRPLLTRCGDGGANQSAAIAIAANSGMTDAAILDARVSYANSAVNVDTNNPGVTVAGTRTRNMLGLTAAVVKGAGLTTGKFFDNSDLDKPGDYSLPALPTNTYVYTTSPGGSSTNKTGNNTLRVAPWLVRRTLSIKELVADIAVAGEAGSVVRMGVWRDNGAGQPDTLVVETGTVPGDVISMQVATFPSVVLTPGLYWVGAVAQNAPTNDPAFRTIGTGWQPPITLNSGSVLPGAAGVGLGWQAGGVSGSMPATFPAPGLTTYAARLLARTA